MTTYRNEALTNGDTTRWLYDEPSGCMTNKLYADGKGPSYSYTPDGKLARRTWARGIVTDYTYDNAGQLVSTTYSDTTPTITMAYDRVGNLINATTAGVVTNLYAYDLYGHCTNEWQNDFNLTRYYDTLGRSTGYAINGTRQTTIAYDTYGRIATMCMAEGRSGVLTASNENEFVWSYLPNTDLKASLQYPNGLTASWTYDANNQLLQVRNATPTNVISQFDYTYDAAGRRGRHRARAHLPARPAPLLRLAHAFARRRHPRHPGAARPRRHLHHPDLHPRRRRRLRRRPPPAPPASVNWPAANASAVRLPW